MIEKKFTILDCATCIDGQHEKDQVVYGSGVSDGYHTMEELYDHRRALNVAFARVLTALIGAQPHLVEKFQAMKSKLHNDGTMFEGYFIVMFIVDGVQISYHYSMEYWDQFNTIPEVERTPPYDGHTSADVVQRLLTKF